MLIALMLCGVAFIGKAVISNYFDRLCQQYHVLADLDAGSNRNIKITGPSCWELQQPLYYEVRDNGVVVSPKFFFDANTIQDRRYALVFAQDKSLVGVLDMTTAPPELVAVYDFESGDSWPRRSSDKGKWNKVFQRLQYENPELVIPPYYK
jgi:hypothetical protein